MPNVLIYQHQSSYNHGCEALAYTISDIIKSSVDNCKITLSSYYKSDDEAFEFPNIESILQNDMWLTRCTLPWFMYQVDKRLLKSKAVQEAFMYCKPCYEAAKEADVCVAIGGDTYCYNKGKEHWPLERKIKKLGKKMMLWGCSIEPDDVPGELAEHLSCFDAITVRDPISYQALLDNNVNTRIYRCADPAFLLPTEEIALPSGGVDGKMVGINLSPMVIGSISDKDKPRAAVESLISHILENTNDNVVFIPHVRLSFNDDVSELKPIYEKFKDTGRIIIIDDIRLNARQLKYIISKCKIFVGARTHATIAAYSTFVPTLAIGYSVKARGIARDIFGSEDGMTISINDLVDENSLIGIYSDIDKNTDVISDQIRAVMEDYKKTALVSGEVLKGLLA